MIAPGPAEGDHGGPARPGGDAATPPALPPSPLAGVELADFAAGLRRGDHAVSAVTTALLERIRLLAPRLDAFTHVAAARAMQHAQALDGLLAAGVDLGPLMGVPVLIKDLFTVDGMPTTAGSRLDVADLVPPQGPFVDRLLRAGCVPLGKTRTTEFALGGYNPTHPLPWNPCDPGQPRMTGGSSHGSAVAMAAQTCGFSVGSDTGGSVRWPAALCGVFGYKASACRWPGDGVFPLSPQFDSIGCFTASAGDAALVEAALDGRTPPPVPHPSTLTLALPGPHFMQRLDAGVAACFDTALARLRDAGVRVIERELAEAGEIDAVFRLVVPADLLAFVGRDRLLGQRDRLDPVAADRAQVADGLNVDDYLRLVARRRQIVQRVRERSAGIDAWLTPTVAVQPAPVRDFQTVAQVAAWNGLATQNTRPANLFDQCAVSLPVHHLGADWPVGLQLCADSGHDARLLAIARAVESVLGRPTPPDCAALVGRDG